MSSEDRGTGRTSAQMREAPRHAVFVWVNDRLDYPQHLARHIGRDDLRVVGPLWLSQHRWRGVDLTGLVLDHAIRLTPNEHIAVNYARDRVRPRAVA